MADEEAQIAAVVVGIVAGLAIAVITFITADGCGIRHAIMHLIGIQGAAVAARAEEHGNHTRVSEASDIIKDVLGAVILVVALRVIHAGKILVAERNLPEHNASVRGLVERADEVETTREIGKGAVV